MEQEINFIVFLTTDWDKFHRKSSLLPLTKYGNVLLVQRTADIPVSSLFFHERIVDIIKRKRVSNLSENLFLFRPFALIHEIIAEEIPLMTKINQSILKKQFLKIIQNLNMHSAPLVLIVYHPFQINFANIFDGSLVIYECYDEYSEDPTFSPRKKRKVYNMEQKLLEISDVVITTSNGLYNNKKIKNTSTYFLPNGVDYNFFASIHDDNVKISNTVKSITHPIIGFLGDVNDTRDIKMLNWLTSKRSDWSFIFIGKNKLTSEIERRYFEEMKQKKNVYIIGWLPEDELLSVCKSFDVGLIPSKVDSTFGKYMFPNKLFEYLAMGLPIVSTDMPELRPFNGLIKVSKTKEDFENNINLSLKEKSSEFTMQRLQMSRDNSWQKRCEKIMDIVNNHI